MSENERLFSAGKTWKITFETVLMLVPLCPAGSVTGRYYFDEFLLAKLPQPFSMTLRTRFGVNRRGATAIYDLKGPNLNVPVLFCCKSPSGDKGVLLNGEVNRLLAELAESGFCRDIGIAAFG